MTSPFLMLLTRTFDDALALGQSGASPVEVEAARKRAAERAAEQRLTRKEVAKRLRVSERYVDALIGDGRLQTIREGSRVFVPGLSLLQYERQRSGHVGE